MRGALELKRPSASADVAWNKAVRTPWVKLTAEERAAGWPDAFTPENLARLQHPYEGTDPEKKRARRDQAALLDALRTNIEDGTLPTVERTRTENEMERRAVTNWNAPRSTWARGLFCNDDRPPTVIQPIKVGERTVTCHVIERAAFRDFLAAQGIEPSEHIRAWLRPLEQAEARQKEAEPASLTPMKRAAIIKRLGRRFEALASALDRPELWAKACRVPEGASPDGKRGWYYLESIEAECCARYGGPSPAAAVDMSPAGQLRAIGK
ncbi:hypothetical protein Tharo_2891 [Thauera aromatica K172]|uniref:Uncharacterized protein n=2 Tax=Thauera aromatica TaxID=59405 RepID=A0A2R4BRE2_THAAR|nr:hypothetical protein Tharo_2891 [Thauera aromatica K172]